MNLGEFGRQEMKVCKCGKNNYEWSVDNLCRSWLKCADCGDNFFSDGMGVILINWDATDINQINIEDVLKSNAHNNGVVVEHNE